MFKSFLDIHLIILQVAFCIRFLNTTTTWRVVMGYRQTNHTTIREVERTLYKSFTKGSAAHNRSTVIILNSTSDNLSSRSRKLVHHYINLYILQTSVANCLEILATSTTSFGVNNHVIVLEKLI